MRPTVTRVNLSTHNDLQRQVEQARHIAVALEQENAEMRQGGCVPPEGMRLVKVEDLDDLLALQRTEHAAQGFGRHGAGTLEQCGAPSCQYIVWLVGGES